MPFYVKVESRRMGTFPGDSKRPQRQDWITGLAFQFVLAPTTSAAPGKHQHRVSFAKRWGASSPLFFDASIENDVLSTVTFEFTQSDPTDAAAPAKRNGTFGVQMVGLDSERVFQRVTLKQVTVTSMRQSLQEPGSGADGATEETDIEEIELACQQLTLENPIGGTTATDAWETPASSWTGGGGTSATNEASPAQGSASGTRVGTDIKRLTTPISILTSGAVQPAPTSVNRDPQIAAPGNQNLPKWGRFAP